MGVKTTFLHGLLEEIIYMNQPEGFEVEEKEHMVCLLKRSLYGLKQSPRQWYKRFDSFIVSSGYNRSFFDSCVYFKWTASGCFIYLLYYVDDMLIVSIDMNAINKIKDLLSSEFKMKNLGATRRILGIKIVRKRNE